MNEPKPIALLDPLPREMDLMFTPEMMAELTRLVDLEPAPGSDSYERPTAAEIDAILPQATYVIGQTDLHRSASKEPPSCKRSSTSRVISCPTLTTSTASATTSTFFR
ncbi:MAG: hypothetical protein ACLFSV_10610 [Alkalispirochaeta sp.]